MILLYSVYKKLASNFLSFVKLSQMFLFFYTVKKKQEIAIFMLFLVKKLSFFHFFLHF